MQRKITLPNGQEVIYDDVPITVTEEGLRAKAAQDPDFAAAFQGVDPQSWVKGKDKGGDLGMSAIGGLTRGAIEGADSLFRKAPTGLAMTGLDAIGAKDALGGLIDVSKKIDSGVHAAVKATGGHYKPKTDAGRYINSTLQGIGGAAGSGTINPWSLALGGVTGAAMQGADDAGLGPAAQLAIAFGLPLGATATRRTLFPKLGYDEVQAAMGIPKRKWYDVGGSPEKRAAKQQLRAAQPVMADADRQGVTLLPAQALQQPNAPQSGIINLQNRITPTTAGATTIKPVLDTQAAQANVLVDNVLSMARESGRYQNELDAARAAYQLLATQPLSTAARQQIVSVLQASPLYRTTGTEQHRFIGRVIGMLENQGSVNVPAQTVNATTAGPGGLPLLNMQTTPAHTVPLPAQTQGQLLDIRQQAARGYPDTQGVSQAQRAEVRTALNQGRSPQVESVDNQFGPAMDKQSFVQRLEDAAGAARNGDVEQIGAHFAQRARGAPGSSTRQEWYDALNPVQFEQPDTARRIGQALTLLERTGYGRGGSRRIEPNEYGQARGSAASAATAAAGLSAKAAPLAIIPGMRQKMLEMETAKIAEALADTSGRKLAKLLNYDPNTEMARNILLSMGIGYGMENAPTGEE